MSALTSDHPHEARLQRFAYGALVLATALGAYEAYGTKPALLGYALPSYAANAALALGLVVGAVGVARRSLAPALAGAFALVVGVACAGALDPGLVGYVAGFGFGALLLAFTELVHQTARYDRAHEIIEEEHVSEESLDRVTDEALKTLLSRTGLAVALAGAGAVLVLALAAVGPGAWREGIETASPLGVAVASLALFALVVLLILSRGATFRAPEKTPSQEVIPDVQD